MPLVIGLAIQAVPKQLIWTNEMIVLSDAELVCINPVSVLWPLYVGPDAL
jgi:hypothetical protein